MSCLSYNVLKIEPAGSTSWTLNPTVYYLNASLVRCTVWYFKLFFYESKFGDIWQIINNKVAFVKFCLSFSTALLTVSCDQWLLSIEGEHLIYRTTYTKTSAEKTVSEFSILQDDWIKWVLYQLSWQDSTRPWPSQWCCWRETFCEWANKVTWEDFLQLYDFCKES